MLSGIGPAEQLRAVGQTVVHDLPGVGENLHDHFSTDITWQLNGPHSYDKYKKLHWQAWAGLQYVLFKTGPVASNIVEGGAFWWSDRSEATPDLQLHFLAGAGVEEGVGTVPGGNGATCNVYHTRPRSRGTVKLRPTIQPPPRSSIRIPSPNPTTSTATSTGSSWSRKSAARPQCGASSSVSIFRRRPEEPGRLRESRTGKCPFKLSPRRHLPDGDGCAGCRRHCPEGTRHRALARHRLIHHAARRFLQHQRPDDRDRGEGGGPRSGEPVVRLLVCAPSPRVRGEVGMRGRRKLRAWCCPPPRPSPHSKGEWGE